MSYPDSSYRILQEGERIRATDQFLLENGTRTLRPDRAWGDVPMWRVGTDAPDPSRPKNPQFRRLKSSENAI